MSIESEASVIRVAGHGARRGLRAAVGRSARPGAGAGGIARAARSGEPGPVGGDTEAPGGA